MNLKTATIIAIFSCVLVVVSLIVLKIYVWPTIKLDIIVLAIGVWVSLVLGGLNMFGFLSSLYEAKESNKLSRLANRAANESNKIAELCVMPNIEFKYELRELKTDYKDVKKSYYEYIQKNLDKYGRKYHHLILFNGGNGQAKGWVLGPLEYEVDGVTKVVPNSEPLPRGQISIYKHNIFPGDDNVQILSILTQNDIFEDANRLRICIKYGDLIGNKHCKCKLFVRSGESRRFVQSNEEERHNIFHIGQAESEDNLRRCLGCFFDVEAIEGKGTK